MKAAAVMLSILILIGAALGTSGCALHDTYLAWYNGEPIGERLNVNSVAECEEACKGTLDCAAWTLNTRNGWCAFKSKEQIKPETNKEGFESAILDDNSEFCLAGPVVDDYNEEDICAINGAEGMYCLDEWNQIICQTDSDCPPISIDTEKKTATEFFCQNEESCNYYYPGITDYPGIDFCSTAQGKEDSACHIPNKCRQECKANKQGGYCEHCRRLVNNGSLYNADGDVLDCCNAFRIKEICDMLPSKVCDEPYLSWELTLSSSIAGQTNSFVSDLSARLAKKTQCPKTRPCRYRGNKCGRLVGLGRQSRIVGCPRRPFNN